MCRRSPATDLFTAKYRYANASLGRTSDICTINSLLASILSLDRSVQLKLRTAAKLETGPISFLAFYGTPGPSKVKDCLQNTFKKYLSISAPNEGFPTHYKKSILSDRQNGGQRGYDVAVMIQKIQKVVISPISAVEPVVAQSTFL